MEAEDIVRVPPDGLRGIVPAVGSIWTWEPEKPHAYCSVVVTNVTWNGEEVWVGCRGTDEVEICWNELSRWVEATVLVQPAPGDE